MNTGQPDEIRSNTSWSHDLSQSDPNASRNENDPDSDSGQFTVCTAILNSRRESYHHQDQSGYHSQQRKRKLSVAHLFGTDSHPNFVDFVGHHCNAVQACPAEQHGYPGDSDQQPGICSSVGFDASKGKARVSSHYQLISIPPNSRPCGRVNTGMCAVTRC